MHITAIVYTSFVSLLFVPFSIVSVEKKMLKRNKQKRGLAGCCASPREVKTPVSL